ncbi:hypothetical protein MKEN_00451800 [Mycena kentingensis (nom. inval.)]|nr:hypothetical protein MKEN_00451800 [Mycena kentingensis (nom. inval.)]
MSVAAPALPVPVPTKAIVPKKRQPCKSCHIRLAPTNYARCETCRRIARDSAVAVAPVRMPVPSVPQKRKAEDTGDDTSTKGDSALVLARLRKKLVLMSLPPTPIAYMKPTATSRTRFVGPDALYQAAKKAGIVASGAYTFSGTFALVADPKTDNERRVKLVAREIKREAALQYEIATAKTHLSSKSHQRFTMILPCTCHTHRIFSKTKSRDILSYFESKTKKNKGDAGMQVVSTTTDPGLACTGTTTISAEDDRSHPLGWLGQRVKVSIQHPAV